MVTYKKAAKGSMWEVLYNGKVVAYLWSKSAAIDYANKIKKGEIKL